MEGAFPTGYYCVTCGRVNVQRFLRHRFCESVKCKLSIDPQNEIGWTGSASFTRDCKISTATIVPDNKWAAPTTAEPATAFDDEACLYHYHMAVDDSSPSGADAWALSVRHLFNGSRVQKEGASALFEALQRDVRIERKIGGEVFSIPQVVQTDPALGRNGPRIWSQQARLVERALKTYFRDLGPLKVKTLRVHAWISDGKVRVVSGHCVPTSS
jgi:hypothetical protein